MPRGKDIFNDILTDRRGERMKDEPRGNPARFGVGHEVGQGDLYLVELGACREIVALLRREGPLTSAELAKRLGYPVQTVEACLALQPSWFAAKRGKWSATDSAE